MALTYFEVNATLKAAISDTSADVEGDPDTQNISSFVYFTASEPQVYDTDTNTIWELPPIRARTNPDDGVVENIDGTAVTLVANTPNLTGPNNTPIETLTYTVTFDHVVYDQHDHKIAGFRFEAPTDDTPVDLTTVERLPQ